VVAKETHGIYEYEDEAVLGIYGKISVSSNVLKPWLFLSEDTRVDTFEAKSWSNRLL
jgi:hypothetical protein